jgi:hypothetical protein
VMDSWLRVLIMLRNLPHAFLVLSNLHACEVYLKARRGEARRGEAQGQLGEPKSGEPIK